MKIGGEHLVALALLALSLAYGVSAMSIDVFPGREHELITSRTFPYSLAVLGAICALWILFSPQARATVSSAESVVSSVPFAWWRCFAVVIASTGYCFALERLGFIVSTGGFLVVGSVLLGERRVGILLASALFVPFAFWLVLDAGLGLHLPNFNP